MSDDHAAATVEANFDGLVGPTHNYAGLSPGNLASQTHQYRTSNPKAAALEGLAKMKRLAELGLHQGVIPPQERPHVATLRRLGYAGSDAEVLRQSLATSPHLLAACSSASCMWAANAATVSPSTNTADGKIHFTPANLISNLHRSIEADGTEGIGGTASLLKTLFPSRDHFVHHAPLPAAHGYGDEGAANHTLLSRTIGGVGVEVFCYGSSATLDRSELPQIHRARQTLEASAAIARLHGLHDDAALFVRQHPRAIDAGVFHNDVISVGHRGLLLYHELAYANGEADVDRIRAAFEARCRAALLPLKVLDEEVSLDDAVSSYLFNSQLVTTADGRYALLCPSDCQTTASTKAWLATLPQREPSIARVEFLPLRQSMDNGGGPACLRLRVTMTPAERAAVAPGVWLDGGLYERLTQWVERHYRDSLSLPDLADPKLLVEVRTALDELTGLLGLGPIYAFQK